MPKDTNKKKKNPILDGDEEETETTGAKTGSKEKSKEPEAVAEKHNPNEPMPAINVARPMIEKVMLPSERKFPGVANNVGIALSADMKKMKTFLEGQEKFPIIVPLEPGEKKGPHCVKEGWLNGFHWVVPKGELVRVPEEIFNVLSQAMQLTNEAGQDKLVSRSADVEAALDA